MPIPTVNNNEILVPVEPMAETILKNISTVIFVISIMLILVYIVKYILYKKNASQSYSDDSEKEAQNTHRFKKPGIGLVVVALILLAAVYITPMLFTKPIIYIYPKEETELSVTLGYPEKISCSYPNYFEHDGWNVKAFPNGDLIDLNSGRKLYSLYWEGKFNKIDSSTNVGFCVKGEDSAKFLEEKLDLLGLNYKEAEEFIVYWLPKLEANKYNYIRFVTTDEFNEYMPLNISDKYGNEVVPDTLIRILMVYKPLSYQIDVEEQIINSQQRQGFTVVEWGGTKI
jgi:hypothetical protein